MISAADLQSVSAAMSVFKAGLDTVRTALGTLKDAKELLPGGKQKEELTGALEQATDQMRAGEAALASALGYSLCRCSFPPVPRLLSGYLLLGHISGMGDERKAMIQRLMDQQKVGGMFAGSVPVHQCPKCKSTDAPGYEAVVKPLPVVP
jgi:hypothetical protein